MKRTRLVPVNEDGRRINEGHPRCTIPDLTVRQLRDDHEVLGLGARVLSIKYALSRSTVDKIIYYHRRLQSARDWRRVEVDVPETHQEEAGQEGQ